MRGCAPPTHVDRLIGALAERQHGVVTYAQLVELGIGRGRIDRRVAAGRLLRLHHGVFAVGHSAMRREGRWLAAVLACGDGAALSHRSAASLWRIRDGEGRFPDVSCAARRRHPAISTHRARLEAPDLTVRFGVPVTSAARTLIDLSLAVDEDEFERAAREAQFRRLFDVVALREGLTRRPSRRVRRMLDDIAPTQSRAEDELLRLCERHGIPRPLTQQALPGGRVDFLWPEQRVVVETDGWQAHSTPAAFQRDRATSNALQLAGYTILRFTWADLTRRRAKVAGEIKRALGVASPRYA